MNTNTKHKEIKEKNMRKEILSYVITILLALSIAYFVKSTIIMSMNIPSASMETTIMTGDKLFGNRLAYLFKNPGRGDIVAFLYPVDGKTYYIKRVIGLPGETVDIKNGTVYIDGKALEEDYITEEWGQDEEDMSFTVPDDSYFMMGDNRDDSADSRYWAEEALMSGVAKDYNDAIRYSFVQKENIKAEAVFRYIGGFKIFHKQEYNLKEPE